jgi:hypothetical protein
MGFGALARLQIARAQKMMGDEASARKWYEDFLALWNDAGPMFPFINKPKPSTPSCENNSIFPCWQNIMLTMYDGESVLSLTVRWRVKLTGVSAPDLRKSYPVPRMRHAHSTFNKRCVRVRYPNASETIWMGTESDRSVTTFRP